MPGDHQVFKTGEFSTSVNHFCDDVREYSSFQAAVQSGQSLCDQRPLLARQRNNIKMPFRWQAKSGPTSCAGWIKTCIRLCSLVRVFVSKVFF